jgi:hypothetical protein
MDQIKLHKVVSLVPPVYFELARLKENTGSYTHYQTRHPAGIFSINFQDAVASLNALLLEVNNTQAQKGPLTEEETETLKRLTTDFLFKLLNYFECGYEIFLSYSPKDARPNGKEHLHKWFSGKEYSGKIRKYYEEVNPTIEKYRLFFNGLKHSSNQISIFHFYKEYAEGRVVGFYLEGVNDSGAISPVATLHPTHKSACTAWSYNFHLPIFYYLLYEIAGKIEDVVKDMYLPSHASDLKEVQDLFVPISLETECSKAFGFARRFEGVFGVVFPQEADQTTKTVLVSEDNASLTFCDYKPKHVAEKDTGYRAVFRSRGDGFSRSWTFLYVSEDSSKMEDKNGNCKNCTHSFALHQAKAHDNGNLRKGGIFKCGVMGCLCELPITFNVNSN